MSNVLSLVLSMKNFVKMKEISSVKISFKICFKIDGP